MLFLKKRKIKVVRQLSKVECGAACLTMILNYYGRRTNITKCRKVIGLGRDGTSALAIVKAAQKMGLKANAYSADIKSIKNVQLPVIIHWKFNHFVILEEWSPTKIKIIDPTIGRVIIDEQEFSANFTGVLLTFKPDENFTVEPDEQKLNLYQYFYRYVPKHSKLTIQILAASILIQLFGLSFPLFTKVVIDSIIPYSSYNLLLVFGLGLLSIISAQILSTYIRSIAFIYLQTHIDIKMITDVFGHLLSLPLSFFQQRSNGDLLMRLSSNSLIRDILTSQTLSLLLDGTMVIVYFIIISIQFPLIGLLVLLLGIFQILIFILTFQKVENSLQAEIHAQSASQSYLVETLSRIEILKANGKESYVNDEWSKLLTKQIKTSNKKSFLSLNIDTATTAIKSLTPAALLWLGAYLILNQGISLGTMLAANSFAILFLSPLTSLISNIQRLQLVNTHLDRLNDIFETDPEQSQTRTNSHMLVGYIDVKNVSFSYSDDSPYILKNVSFSIKKGEKVAIVGETGSGKSSLLKVLLGLYPLSEGNILYDNIPMQEINKNCLRRQIGTVLQDPKLFAGSIRKNVCFGLLDEIPFEDVVSACEIASIHEEICQMPMHYETVVSEENGGLSGGQCQRIAIARALVNKPKCLFLDEATSHLDLLTESKVDQNLSSLSCTRIVIAHRLSTVKNADKILVMHEGEIVESGTHEFLIGLKGKYFQLTKASDDRKY